VPADHRGSFPEHLCRTHFVSNFLVDRRSKVKIRRGPSSWILLRPLALASSANSSISVSWKAMSCFMVLQESWISTITHKIVPDDWTDVQYFVRHKSRGTYESAKLVSRHDLLHIHRLADNCARTIEVDVQTTYNISEFRKSQPRTSDCTCSVDIFVRCHALELGSFCHH
jgi:hypothetical protein